VYTQYYVLLWSFLSDAISEET